MSPAKEEPLGATEPMTAGFFANFLSHQSIYAGSIEDMAGIDKGAVILYISIACSQAYRCAFMQTGARPCQVQGGVHLGSRYFYI